MKKQLIIGLFAIAAATTSVNAQEAKPAGGPPTNRQAPQKPDAEKRREQNLPHG